MPLEKHEFLQGLEADELEHVRRLLERREVAAHKLVVRKGEPADALYLLVSGRLSVVVDTPQGRLQRLSTLSPGMGFGEIALITGATRSASVRADEPSVCWLLPSSAYRALAAEHAPLKIKLLENLLRTTSRIVSRMNVEAAEEGS
jgi:CRP-like cAMP-binding protein